LKETFKKTGYSTRMNGPFKLTKNGLKLDSVKYQVDPLLLPTIDDNDDAIPVDETDIKKGFNGPSIPLLPTVEVE
jgi:hypothetical protein